MTRPAPTAARSLPPLLAAGDRVLSTAIQTGADTVDWKGYAKTEAEALIPASPSLHPYIRGVLVGETIKAIEHQVRALHHVEVTVGAEVFKLLGLPYIHKAPVRGHQSTIAALPNADSCEPPGVYIDDQVGVHTLLRIEFDPYTRSRSFRSVFIGGVPPKIKTT